MKVKSLSHVRLLATPWTAAHQAPLSMGFSKQEYWSGVPLPSPFSLHITLYYLTFVDCTITNFTVCILFCILLFHSYLTNPLNVTDPLWRSVVNLPKTQAISLNAFMGSCCPHTIFQCLFQWFFQSEVLRAKHQQHLESF